jgi:hypothetical protein
LKSSTVDGRCSAVSQYQALCEFHISTRAMQDRIDRGAILQGFSFVISQEHLSLSFFHFNPESCHFPFKYSAVPSFVATFTYVQSVCQCLRSPDFLNSAVVQGIVGFSRSQEFLSRKPCLMFYSYIGPPMFLPSIQCRWQDLKISH